MTPAQIGKVRAMLANAGIADKKEKEDFVLMVTGGRTESLKACTYPETQYMIAYLNKNTQQPQFGNVVKEAADRQRRYIMAMAQQMHWKIPHPKKPGEMVVDMPRINEWCIKYSPQHLPLDEIADVALPAVVTQFKKVLNSFLIGF